MLSIQKCKWLNDYRQARACTAANCPAHVNNYRGTECYGLYSKTPYHFPLQCPKHKKRVPLCHLLNIRHNGQLDTVLPTQTFENDLIVLQTEQV